MNILVTGATGYIGGRLIPRLLEAGHRVRVLVRNPDRITGRPWADRVDMHVGDLTDASTLGGLCDDIDAAYYLVHAMTSAGDFAQRDRQAANNFVHEAKDVPHTIYLGGLVPSDGTPSKHLASRAEVGAILRAGLSATEFRAGPIIGSGSASFEMVRYLTERLPAMIAPKWINNQVQPIGVKDMLRYLVGALEAGPSDVIEVGAEPIAFKSMMHVYADVRGLRRHIVPVPVLAPALAARWIGLVTPITNRLAVPLVEGVVQPLLADTARATSVFSSIAPIPYREAVRRALEHTVQGTVETRWTGALHSEDSAYHHSDWQGIIKEVRTIDIATDHTHVFETFCRVGGEAGWPAWNFAWRLRGMIDALFGGPGLRRGRRHPTELFVGESLDFWRVEAVEPSKRLLLRAEMKVPGRAWLQWEAVPEGTSTRLVQSALFVPDGLAGTLYWYALYPIHKLIFRDMLKALARRAERYAP